MERCGKPEVIILHPLPRMDELDSDLDETRYAAYWDESMLGVPLRMALLSVILGTE